MPMRMELITSSRTIEKLMTPISMNLGVPELALMIWTKITMR